MFGSIRDFPARLGALVTLSFSVVAGWPLSPSDQMDREQVTSICIDDLAVPDQDREAFNAAAIPESILQLAGKRIRIQGNMIPSLYKSGFLFSGVTRGKSYPLATPIQDLPIQCLLIAATHDGQKLTFTDKTITVEGELAISPVFSEDGTLYVLYRLRDVEFEKTSLEKGRRRSLTWGC